MSGLFALGSNGSGQLGIGHREDVSVPKQALLNNGTLTDTIIQIAAGGNHTVLLTESGNLYCSGDASNGACGLAGCRDKGDQFHEFRLSNAAESATVLGRVAYVACTWDTSTIVIRDQNGKATMVYLCGGGDTPAPNVASEVPKITLLPNFPPLGTEIVDLAAGLAHVVLVLDNGDVFGWGNGRKGQLGPITESSPQSSGTMGVASIPIRIQGLRFKARKAVCGQQFTCLVGETTKGEVAVLGPDKWGVVSTAPPAIPSWKMVCSSWSGIYVLKHDGALVAWGRDDHGQLAPPGLPKLKSIAAGSEHTLGLTEDGEVLAWGWGEHGNCGPHLDQKGDVKGRWNVIASSKNLPEGSTITAIGAGCATSWINITAEGIFL